MTTIESYNTHKKVAKIIRSMGINAKSVNNKNFDFNNYEVRVEGATEEEIKALLNLIWRVFENKMINIVSC